MVLINIFGSRLQMGAVACLAHLDNPHLREVMNNQALPSELQT